MVRIFLVLMSVVLITSSAVIAKNNHNNGNYNGNGEYYCGFITAKLNPCCQGYGDSEKCKQKQYKNWNKRCKKHKGKDCSYNFWYDNRSWDDDAWYAYWNTDAYKNAQKVNRKVNVFRNVVNSTKELFTW